MEDDQHHPAEGQAGEEHAGEEPQAHVTAPEGMAAPAAPTPPPAPQPPSPPFAQPEAREHVEQEVPAAGATAAGAEGPAHAESYGEPSGTAPGSKEAEAPRWSGPRIEIGVVEGDLHIVGGASHVTLDQPNEDEAEGSPRDRGGALYFARVPDGTRLRVPDGVVVVVREVRGDLSVQGVDGQLEVTRVGGDVALDGIALARLAAVRGDLSAANGGELELRNVSGDAEITSVGRLALDGSARADLTLREVKLVELRGAIGGDAAFERCGAVTLEGAVGHDLTVNQCAGALRARSVGGDATIAQVRAVTLGSVGGDLEIGRCLGPVRVSSVGGDAGIGEVESLNITTVGGDLTVDRVPRTVEVRSVGGDAEVARIGGRIAIAVVGSDLEVEWAPGGVVVEKVGGDAELDSELGPGAEYAVFAGGDVTLRVRGEVNARFVAQAGGEVSTELPLTVERGRRRHLVGVLGRGEATVTLRSGGDIEIVAADGNARSSARRASMSDEHEGQGPEDETSGAGGQSHGGAGTRTWEGTFGGKRFRLRWEQGPGRAGMHFQGPIDEEDPDAVGGPYNRAFGFEWERGRGARTYGEYEERLRELGDKAERVARKAAEQAQDLAEEAARKTRETDWEAVGREVRGAISKAMSELEDAFTRVRSEWEGPGRPTGGTGTGQSGRGGSTAQRVRIEQEEEQQGGGTSQSSTSSQTNYSNQTTGGTGYGTSSNYSSSTSYSSPGAYSSSSSSYGSGASEPSAGAGQGAQEDREAQRRQVLEQLRSGQITLDEAERRLNDLR